MLDPQQAVSEGESLCQAQVSVQWLPSFHPLGRQPFLTGTLPNDANFWEGGPGPSVLILVTAWVEVRSGALQ